MIYTFQKRKELNSFARELYPGVKYSEGVAGIPRMRTKGVPEGAVAVTDVEEMRRIASAFWAEHRCPMPVFLIYPVEKWQEPRPVEVNFVSHYSRYSMAEAGRYIAGGRLFVMDKFLNDEV